MTQETKKKKRRKQQTTTLELEQNEEIQNAMEVTEILEDLQKQGKRLDIQVCPKCKSPRVRRAQTNETDLFGHMGALPPKFQCDECGWQARLVLNATNKPLTVKEVELMLEANEAAERNP